MKALIYGSPICPDCVELQRILQEKNADYDYVNITENTANMKAFLQLRDSRKEFDDIRRNRYIGIPVMLLEDKLYFYEDILRIFAACV